jgi:hypothetical protein
MEVHVNDKIAATGKPGSYVVLDRSWSEGDTVRFTLPAALRLTRYVGVDQIPDHERYAVEYGPVLLAAVGTADVRLKVTKGKHPDTLLELLKPTPGQPLHYTVEHNPGIELMPYWLVDKQPFTCLPAVRLRA